MLPMLITETVTQTCVTGESHSRSRPRSRQTSCLSWDHLNHACNCRAKVLGNDTLLRRHPNAALFILSLVAHHGHHDAARRQHGFASVHGHARLVGHPGAVPGGAGHGAGHAGAAVQLLRVPGGHHGHAGGVQASRGHWALGNDACMLALLQDLGRLATPGSGVRSLTAPTNNPHVRSSFPAASSWGRPSAGWACSPPVCCSSTAPSPSGARSASCPCTGVRCRASTPPRRASWSPPSSPSS